MNEQEGGETMKSRLSPSERTIDKADRKELKKDYKAMIKKSKELWEKECRKRDSDLDMWQPEQD